MTAQRNELVEAVLAPYGVPELTVHVARWPSLDGRAPQVMWRWGTSYSYLPPADARRLAAALVRAAGLAKHDPVPSGPEEG